MRIEGNIAHPHFKIVVYGLDSRYFIQIEAGQMMQAFKISKDEVAGLDGIRQLLSQEFLSRVHDRFNEMYIDLNSAKERCV
jgi:hypothetical protein